MVDLMENPMVAWWDMNSADLKVVLKVAQMVVTTDT